MGQISVQVDVFPAEGLCMWNTRCSSGISWIYIPKVIVCSPHSPAYVLNILVIRYLIKDVHASGAAPHACTVARRQTSSSCLPALSDKA